MFNQIKSWYDKGFIDDEKLSLYLRGKLITQEQYDTIKGGINYDDERAGLI